MDGAIGGPIVDDALKVRTCLLDSDLTERLDLGLQHS